MGVGKKVITDIFETIEDVSRFVIGVIVVSFIAGAYYGVAYEGTPAFWYPVILLFLVLLWKVLDEISDKTKKKK